MMYIPKHFTTKEMVPPELGTQIQKRGNNWAWIHLFDDRLLRTMDGIRHLFGPLQVNTWNEGGNMRYRGFRPADCDVGALYSQHRFGRAVDLIPLDPSITVDNLRDNILYHSDCPEYQHIGGIELGVPWLHIDVRARIDGKILAFFP